MCGPADRAVREHAARDGRGGAGHGYAERHGEAQQERKLCGKAGKGVGEEVAEGEKEEGKEWEGKGKDGRERKGKE